LHIYDVSNDKRVAKFNSVTHVVGGGGVFHGAVQVYGLEYSFGGSDREETGVFCNKPRQCPMHHYRESIFLGDCDLTRAQVHAIVDLLKPQWMAPSYNLLRRNCCSFSKELAAELGVGNVPAWLHQFADYGAQWDDYLKARQLERAQKEAGYAVVEPVEEEEKSAKIDEPSSHLVRSEEEEGIEVSELSDGVIITPLDHIMAVRVQRAYRSSSNFGSASNLSLE